MSVEAKVEAALSCVRGGQPDGAIRWLEEALGEVREAEAAEAVGKLPRRVAHVTFALLAAAAEQKGGATTAEVMLYDEEALSARETAAALRHAQRKGLAVCGGKFTEWRGPDPDPGRGRLEAKRRESLWVPTPLAYDLRKALESRFLRERGERDG